MRTPSDAVQKCTCCRGGAATAGEGTGDAAPGDACSLTSPMKRMPLRAAVRISACCSPLSPIALRTAVMRLLSVELRHDAAAPDRGDQVVLGDDPVAVLNQIDKQIKDLRLDLDQIRAAPQLAPADVERIVAENGTARLPRIRIPAGSQGIIRTI